MNDTLADDLVKAVNRVAAAYERMADMAERKQSAPPPTNGAEPETKTRKAKGDVLTVTDRVVNFGVVTGANGEPKLAKNGKKYWKLKLAGGFEAMVFSESQSTRLAKAFTEGLTVIIEYTTDGKYSNIESVKLASGVASPSAARQQPAAEQKLSCGHFPSEGCDCAF